MWISEEKFKERVNHPANLVNIKNVLDELSDEGKNDSDNGAGKTSDISIDSEVMPKSDEDLECSNEKEDLVELAFGRILDEGIIINTPEKRNIGKSGMVKGDVHIPQVIRDIVTVQSHFDSGANLAKHYGISPSQVNNYKHGTPNRHNPNSAGNLRAQKVIESQVTKIKDKVHERILFALDMLTNEKLVDLDAKGISQIVRNLSGVISGVEPKRDDNNKTVNVQTIFYNPGQADLSAYEKVEVNS